MNLCLGEQTVQCPICKEPYVIYPYYAGDQSACEKCRTKARQNLPNSNWREDR
jgi:hypothetical protein